VIVGEAMLGLLRRGFGRSGHFRSGKVRLVQVNSCKVRFVRFFLVVSLVQYKPGCVRLFQVRSV
jgi:hypothetical protein